MAREYCQRCEYPLTACVCYAIRPFQHQTEVIVLQHPSEVKHQKNSVRLLKLAMADVSIWVGESAADFSEQLATINDNKPTFVVYPSNNSEVMTDATCLEACRLIFIDGTWRKAFKMWQLNTWLQQYPSLHLNIDSLSQYTIRKAKRSDSLSTLEAVALSIATLDVNCDVSPLTDALAAMVEQRMSHMTEQVKQRY